jgi:DNA-binding NarL/FixJ family response regulator
MIHVLIADDHAVVRSGLKQIIATASDLFVAGEASSGAEVVEELRRRKIDLLLLDMTMPGLSGVALIQRIRAERSGLPILILSIHNESPVVTRALRAGATGYVTKDSDPEVIINAIRKVSNGGRFIDPKLVDALVFEVHGDPEVPAHQLLSDREFQVLQMIAQGRSINDIADSFSLSAKTISTYKVRLMQKLNVENNADLIKYAVKHGLAGG